MKTITREMLRGEKLFSVCKIAKTTTGKYGPDDHRVCCYGIEYETARRPMTMCERCEAFINNIYPLNEGAEE